MSNELTLKNQDTLPVTNIREQVNLIQTLMKDIMKDGEHYGKIPGCGDKPALLKPGAEKLSLTFRMAPTYEEERIELPNGHREYIIKCTLTHIGSGNVLGQGVGSCSTMESKYRYRTGPKESTGKPVPKEYWDYRKSDPAKAFSLLGGKGFVAAKNEAGIWEICRQGEKVENENPADNYNTVLKMAKKRAHVDAVLTATAASDIFTQDIEEELPEEASIKNVTPPKQKQEEKQKTEKKQDYLTFQISDYSTNQKPNDKGKIWYIAEAKEGKFFTDKQEYFNLLNDALLSNVPCQVVVKKIAQGFEILTIGMIIPGEEKIA